MDAAFRALFASLLPLSSHSFCERVWGSGRAASEQKGTLRDQRASSTDVRCVARRSVVATHCMAPTSPPPLFRCMWMRRERPRTCSSVAILVFAWFSLRTPPHQATLHQATHRQQPTPSTPNPHLLSTKLGMAVPRSFFQVAIYSAAAVRVLALSRSAQCHALPSHLTMAIEEQ